LAVLLAVPCGRQHDLKERTHEPAYKLAETEKFLIKSHKEELTESGGNTTTLRETKKKKKKKRACATPQQPISPLNKQQTDRKCVYYCCNLRFSLKTEKTERGGGWVSKSKHAWSHNQKDTKKKPARSTLAPHATTRYCSPRSEILQCEN
jgi:hypothetical protein